MNTIVTVKEGALEGAFSDDKQSVIFKGVPYAAPPVGELRWKRPQPHAKWEGVRPHWSSPPKHRRLTCPKWTSTARSFTVMKT